MADEVHSEAALRVTVEGAPQLQSLTTALQNLNKAVTGANANLKPAAVNAAGATAMTQAVAKTRAAQKAAEKEIEANMTTGQRLIVRAVKGIVEAPFNALQFAGGAIKGFATSITPALGKIPASVLAIGGIGLAAGGLLLPILKLVAGFKLLSLSFGWAQEQAEASAKVASETRRRYPGLVGEAFEKAEDETNVRLNTLTALFGKGAEGIAESVERKLMDAQLGHASLQDSLAFQRWGINNVDRAAFERRTGRRVDLLTYLEQFVTKREQIDRELRNTPEGPRKEELRRVLGQYADDTFSIFGKQFSDLALRWSGSDLRRLRQQMDEAASLGTVKDADRKTTDFNIALWSLMGTFDAIRQGIGGDVQPTITNWLNDLRKRLIEPDRQGRVLGDTLRKLGADLSIKAWEVLDDLLRRIDVDKVNDWLKEVGKINAKEAADSIISFAKSLGVLLKVIAKGIEWAAWFSEGSDQAGSTMGGITAPFTRFFRGGGANPNFAAPPDIEPGARPGATAPAAPPAPLPPGGARVPTTSVEEARARPISFNGAGSPVPAGVEMTEAERNFLGLVRQYESKGGQNIPNYKYQPGFTAQGRYQLTMTNWRWLAPQLGITAPSPMAATDEEQTRVALELKRRTGIGNWVNFNPRLAGAVARGERSSLAGRAMLNSDTLNTTTKSAAGLPTQDGASFGRAAGQSFVDAVKSVPVNVKVPDTSGNVPPYSDPTPTGGDTPY